MSRSTVFPKKLPQKSKIFQKSAPKICRRKKPFTPGASLLYLSGPATRVSALGKWCPTTPPPPPPQKKKEKGKKTLKKENSHLVQFKLNGTGLH